MARDAGLVAVATAHGPSDLSLTETVWMQWVLVVVHECVSGKSQLSGSNALSHTIPEKEPSRAVRVQLFACR